MADRSYARRPSTVVVNAGDFTPTVIGLHCDVDAERGHRFQPSTGGDPKMLAAARGK